MAHYQLILAYDGTNYSGFQRQKEKPTIQYALETALRRLGWNKSTILAAGRTDAGVHASGQVVQIDLDWAHTTGDLCNAINAYLPKDISVRAAAVIHEESHPRYDACARSYRYQVFCEPLRNPLKERFSWRVWPELDRNLLQTSAELFIGTYDFSAFGSPVRRNGSTIRTVFESFWTFTDEALAYQITANAFLYHMVRRIVFQQVLAALHKINVDQLDSGLRNKELKIKGLAPANGLYLEKVFYEE